MIKCVFWAELNYKNGFKDKKINRQFQMSMYDLEKGPLGLCVCRNFRQIRRAIITLLGCNSFNVKMLDRHSFYVI